MSNAVGQIEGQLIEERVGANMLHTLWGQLVDHDITLVTTTEDDPLPIIIPKCDAFMDRACAGNVTLDNTRSLFDTTKAVRTQINVNTPWIDGSIFYGTDKVLADSLRLMKNGKLLMGPGNIPPKDQLNTFFISGDERINENVGLAAMQTVFMREHNRICDIALAKNPQLTD